MIRYWRILRAQKRPLRFLLSRILMRLGLSRWLTIKQEGFVLRFYPSSLSAALWIDPADHQAEAAFLRAYLRSGDVAIDVGANIGLTALAASRAVGDSGAVLAVEPHPRIFGYLRKNVALNQAGNVTLFNVALGNREEAGTLRDMRADDTGFLAPGGSGIEVPVRRLDQLPIPNASIALMKIDVEGYERFVLEGAAATLPRTQCVYFESWDQHFARYGYGAADLVGDLSQAGFQVFRLDEPGWICPVSGSHASAAVEDLVALRDLDDFLTRTGLRVQG